MANYFVKKKKGGGTDLGLCRLRQWQIPGCLCDVGRVNLCISWRINEQERVGRPLLLPDDEHGQERVGHGETGEGEGNLPVPLL